MASRQRRRDARVCKKKVADSRREASTAPGNASAKDQSGKITGHWGEDAVGFRWTEADSVDDRLTQMDTGRFYSATIYTPREATLKGIAVRIGEQSEAAVLFDTELLRVTCGWTGGFLQFNPARYGIIVPPKVRGEIAFHSPRQPGWARVEDSGQRTADSGGKWSDAPQYGPLPRAWAKYRGLHVHGDRVVFEYSVGPHETVVRESPWLELIDGKTCITRDLEIAPCATELELLVASADADAKLLAEPNVATLERGDQSRPTTVKVLPHDKPVRLTLAFPTSLAPRDGGSRKVHSTLQELSQPGPARWTQKITTRGVVADNDKNDALVVDTLTLPFDNPHKALMFVSGHDFLSRNSNSTLATRHSALSADAAICTLHGDVWLVSGLDDTLNKLTWKRFATGLFQPLGLKIVNGAIHVVGRDQITRLHDQNGDGEADWYENFNNDAHVTTNGHEYVTCLETDSDGWFYFVKGNADGKTEHDGCLLRVSPNGRKLEVVATGFRNANGLGIGRPAGAKADVITVAPQEGEWTPGSGIFEARPGGFYGYTPSAHRAAPPKSFIAPLCWIPRLQDNSCGSQVWLPPNHWGPNVPSSLHLSYGTSRAFLFLIERIGSASLGPVRDTNNGTPPPFLSDGQGVSQGGTVALPLKFESGVMRGRVNPHDGHLYVSGLRGWVSNAEKDGCFQRVRRTKAPLHMPVAVESHRNGVIVRFSDALPTEVLADPDNYRVQQWSYRWSSAYGSPELRVSQPNQEGRDNVEVLSATPLREPGRDERDADAVFLELKDFRPVDQLALEMTLATRDGRSFERRIDYTVHATRSDAVTPSPLPQRLRPGQLAEAERAKLQPGLRLSIRHSGSQRDGEAIWRSLRMATWHFEPHELRGLLSGDAASHSACEFVAEGAIEISQRGRYRFTNDGSGASEVTIGEQFVTGEVELPRGWHRLKIVQRVPAAELTQPVRFRLLWHSPAFETEPVPPTALLCEPIPVSAQQQQRGQELFARHLCHRCHRVSAEIVASRTAMPELSAEAPRLDSVGSRLNQEWLFDWLLDPQATRPDARMPRLFDASDTSRQQAADVAAYLTQRLSEKGEGEAPAEPRTTGKHGSAGASPSRNPAFRTASQKEVAASGRQQTATANANGDYELGRQLWEQLGCLGCHRLTAADDDSAVASAERMPLRHVVAKFAVGELATFLQQPQRHFEWTRMPNFSLSTDEAASLARLLLDESSKTNADGNKASTLPDGDAARGRELFEKLGCRQCHRVSADAPLPNAPLKSAFGVSLDRGCLASSETRVISNRVAHVPDFRFDAKSLAALQAFLRTGHEPQLAQDLPDDVSRRWIRDLQCRACHARDGQAARLPEILSEESESGLPPENVPNLTWAGEKLHTSWLASFVKGHVAERPRPWMKLRMPSFSASRAEWLAQGLAREHGLSGHPEPRNSQGRRATPSAGLTEGRGADIRADDASSAVGEMLATRPGLLDCRQCHAIGPLPPTGDKQTLLAPGINFSHVHERLRFDYYRRFTLDPPRYDITTRMPKLAVDGQTTKVKDIFDGNARQQFKAVWNYIQSIPSPSDDP